jgi:hypothetical protein
VFDVWLAVVKWLLELAGSILMLPLTAWRALVIVFRELGGTLLEPRFVAPGGLRVPRSRHPRLPAPQQWQRDEDGMQCVICYANVANCTLGKSSSSHAIVRGAGLTVRCV